MTFSQTLHRTLLPLFTLGSLGIPSAAIAQSITPAPDGTGTIINYNGNIYHITGGTQAGANLFHSFQQFGLQPSEIADFLSNPAIQNVVGRVVGGDPSVIEGLIRLSGGNSNLFLMNPAGWVFADGASIDVPGSFGVTTANRIGFGDEFFNAIGGNDYATLTGDPTSLIFDSNQPGAIINAADLNVENGSLWMVGGSVISTGSITASNGTVTLAAVPGESKVKLSHDGMKLSFFLDALAVDEVAPGTPLGIRAVDLPTYLNGSSAVGNANEVVTTENGEPWLVGSGLRVEDGDVVVGDRVTAENVNLVAAGRVQVADPGEIEGESITVVRYPKAGDRLTYNFIDSLIDDPESFLYGGEQGSISTLVGSQDNGIEVVTERLADVASEGAELDGVRIVAEGNEGNFWLGNAWVTSDTIHNYSEQIASWSDALTDSADLLLYSCFTALGATGEALVSTLANLTGADVAASTNITGSESFDGDWELEYQIGTIELGLGFEPEVIEDYEGKLAVFTATNAASLIAAIAAANGNGQTDTINLAGNITLTAINNATDGNNGLPSITAAENLTINGMGNTIARSGGAPDFRLFHVALGADLTINETTLTGGVADPNVAFGSFFPGADGGAIYNNGTLTISNSTISGNSALDDGGAINSDAGSATAAVVTIINSTISGNSAAGNGGGISNTTFTGAGANTGVINITNSTISGNSANLGGGIASIGQNASNSAVVNVTNSTISSNTAVFGGGGIYNRGQTSTLGSTVVIENSTIANNVVSNPGSSAGGILNLNVGVAANAALVTVRNSIIAQNTATVHPDFRQASATNSPITDLGNNLIGVDDQGVFTTSTLVGTVAAPLAPLLGPLTVTFGTTATHDLLDGSPARDAGDATVTTVTTDQRGLLRIFNGAMDIGALEWQPLPVTAASSSTPATAASSSTTPNADIWPNPLAETEELTDKFLRNNACQSVPNIELGASDTTNEEELAAVESIELDENCLPINE